MNIEFSAVKIPDSLALIEVFDSSGIKRPTSDQNRIQEMLDNSNLIVTAWEKEKLIGIARSLTDYSYCCYLSDLAVRKEYQKMGIGKKLIDYTRKLIGDRCMLLLLSAPEAINYYPKVGFKKVENGFIINRET